MLDRVVMRVEVVGDSMKPTLWPGDRVLAVRWLPVRVGDLVLLRDPRAQSGLLVKRVVDVSADGVTVEGDNRGASTDSRRFGSVPVATVTGRVVRRY